jgi:RNA polymerase sigma-70 factor (ECF subfamily)
VNALPEEYQSVLLLWAVEDFSYKEIAAAVDVPIGTVMSRLHRARERLSVQLRDFAKSEGIVREYDGSIRRLNSRTGGNPAGLGCCRKL